MSPGRSMPWAGEAVAIFPAGGAAGEMIRHLLDAEGVAHQMVAIAGFTRESLAVEERQSGKQYRFLLPGPVVGAADQERCLDLLSSAAAEAEFIVASGSLPLGVPQDFYARIGAPATACWPGSCSVSAVISRCARPCGSASPRERRRFLGPVPSAAGATMSSASIGVLAAAPYPHGSCRSGHCRSRPYGFLRKPLARCAAILRRRLGLTEHAAISASWDRRALPAISVSRRCVGYVCHHRFPLVRPRKGVRRPGIIIGSGGRGVASAQFIPPPRSGASS